MSTRQAWIVGALGLGIVFVAGAGLLPVLHASLIAAIALVVFGVLTPGQARDAVDLEVIILIAAAFSLAAAIERSGLADGLAGALVSVFDDFGTAAALLAVVVATIALTELITNNAAAALLFPIAIAVAASASFLTPIGYQTNTMVYGPGGTALATTIDWARRSPWAWSSRASCSCRGCGQCSSARC